MPFESSTVTGNTSLRGFSSVRLNCSYRNQSAPNLRCNDCESDGTQYQILLHSRKVMRVCVGCLLLGCELAACECACASLMISRLRLRSWASHSRRKLTTMMVTTCLHCLWARLRECQEKLRSRQLQIQIVVAVCWRDTRTIVKYSKWLLSLPESWIFLCMRCRS